MLLYVNKLIINELSLIIIEGNKNIRDIIIKLAIYVMIEVVSVMIFNVFQFYLGKIKLKYDDSMIVSLVKHISNLDMSYYDDPNYYNLTKQAGKYYTVILNNYNSLLNLLFSCFSLITALIISTRFSIIITMLSIVLTIPHLLVKRKLKMERHSMEKDVMNKQRVTDYLLGIFLNKNVEMEMQLYGFKEYIFDKIYVNQNIVRSQREEFSLKHAKKELLLLLIKKSIYLLQQAFLVAIIVTKQMTIGDFSFYNGIIKNLSTSVSDIINQINEICINDIKFKEYLDIIGRKPRITSKGTYALDNNASINIEFKNVSFKYPNSKEYILNNISFSIKQGEKIALIGKNGAGKTTLIKLLLRFYDPTEGEILINNINIRDFELSLYRRMFSAMFQESILYMLPMKDNIVISDIARNNEPDVDNDIKNILSGLGFDNINDSKIDLNRYYGKEFYSDGYILSKGQQQRMYAARMLFHRGKMFILDEPAASLDAISESRFLSTLEKYANGKTVLYITHRYNNLKTMDNIILLDKGSIREQGTHSQLIENKGLYSELYAIQTRSEEKNDEKNCIN
jgi:ATP-binding cassette subfamily B protein